MTDTPKMTPNKPHIIRAIFEWILENDCTPYIVVAADFKHVIVPTQFIQDGKIVLNISPKAVAYLVITNDFLTFNARFGGIPMDIQIPIGAIISLYAMENGEGGGFELYETEQPISSNKDKISPSAIAEKSKFTVLENSSIEDQTNLYPSAIKKKKTPPKKTLTEKKSIKTESQETEFLEAESKDGNPSAKTKKKNKTTPTLKVIK